jgi:hypothetical protein
MTERILDMSDTVTETSEETQQPERVVAPASTPDIRNPFWRALRSAGRYSGAGRVIGALAIIAAPFAYKALAPDSSAAQTRFRTFVPLVPDPDINQSLVAVTPGPTIPTPTERPVTRRTLEQSISDANEVDKIPLPNDRNLILLEDQDTTPGQIYFSNDPNVRQKVVEVLGSGTGDLIISRFKSINTSPTDINLIEREYRINGEWMKVGYTGGKELAANSRIIRDAGYAPPSGGIQSTQEFIAGATVLLSTEVAYIYETGFGRDQRPQPYTESELARIDAVKKALVPLIQFRS